MGESLCHSPSFDEICSDPYFWKLKYEKDNLPLPPSGMRSKEEWLEDYRRSLRAKREKNFLLWRIEKGEGLEILPSFLSSITFLTFAPEQFIKSWKKGGSSAYLVKIKKGYSLLLSWPGGEERFILSDEETNYLLYRLIYDNPRTFNEALFFLTS